MKNTQNPKLISFYFPQFHPIPENDQWWGEGFQDWKLVKEAKPQYAKHYQPKAPMDGVYYNPCDKEVVKKQAKQAKEYGVHGFMLYHYWFDGKLMLEKPLEVFRDNPDIDINFCICWANETWTRAWVGKPQDILIAQKHTPDVKIWRKHFEYLLPFFKDSRAIKKDNKPIVIIYQPHLIQNSDEMIKCWREWALENGLDGLYVIANKNHSYSSTKFLSSYDAILKFQPREAHTSKYYKKKTFANKFQFLRVLPEWAMNILRSINYKMNNVDIVDAQYLWNIILRNAYKQDYPGYNLELYESGFFEWDNTARYGNKARIFTGLSAEQKQQYLTNLYMKATENKSEFIFWNAWNEWSEGSYLEPDDKNGFEHLKIIRNVFKSK